ncbi:MAG: AbrB/MazE/SpoVT family DNA-binding domain-containing protein [Patescibacteria group bacterium]
MSLAIAITSNWQMHIPQAMREAAGLNAPGIVMATVSPGEITIRPQKSKIMSLAGSLHAAHLKNPIDIDNIRNYIDYSKA